MTATSDDRSPPRRPPGPKPSGRTVVAMAITVTHAQRAALETMADAEAVSISTVVRRFVAAGLIGDAPVIPASHGAPADRADARVVAGHALVPLGMAGGRALYRATSHGDVYLLVPDGAATYLLQRPADSYAGAFGTLEEAVAHIDALEGGEAWHRTRIVGHITR